MAGNKRERELARAKYERQQARRASQAGKRRRNQRIVAAVVVVALVLGSVAWAVLATRGGDAPVTDGPSIDPSDFSSLVASVEASASASAAADASGSGATAPALTCASPGPVRADDVTFPSAPATTTATSLTLTTNCGPIVIALDPAAPVTAASEAFLAQQGFYDGTQCHRLTTDGIWVLQCGDPAGDGTGGPGYAIPDENLPAEGSANYPAGTVAMANSGPNTNGSQFFIVYKDTTLPASYTIWGKVTEGLDIVEQVAAAGTTNASSDGPPAQPVVIESATVQP